ncbi:efflux RND transporter periplasmic adaptor subunit [Sphingobium sp. AP49]|uniref:efflux RND transporter periplasmic adaptor subunit n=1 Tax=Sphingobium sp. AP49 TaxID=1144307 RepID=UPI00026EDACE|nr:efflux RND transporter periplasmic adaptor subunit [Sphingobium sp. AP49]WHO38877.1 efflux RND transporter periplasmic adaptor subunit [Sphingobium sp. AP49]
MKNLYGLVPLPLMWVIAACSAESANEAQPAAKVASHADEGAIAMSEDQIRSAGIQIGRPVVGGSGTIELPATIEGDPQGVQVVSAAIGGRVVALTRNLGQSVGRGDTLAVIESREAALLNAGIEAARARLGLANATLAREQRLFAQRVSPEQDLIAARTAAAEARIALRLAQGQMAATGSGGGLNRVAITAPLSGQVIARSIVLGQTVAADTELFRVGNLSTVSLSLNLQPQDAGRVRPGTPVMVEAPGRKASARISFISPVLDAGSRLVPAIATLDNKGGQWRVGEAVTASVALSGNGNGAARVPSTAVQYVEGRSVVFVRTGTGFRAVPVTVGDMSGDSVIVRSGLKGNERIATINSFTLKAELGKGEASHED